jgi:hypothetical protein
MGMMGSSCCAIRQGVRQIENRIEMKMNWRVFVRQQDRSDPFRMNFPVSERAQTPSATVQSID